MHGLPAIILKIKRENNSAFKIRVALKRRFYLIMFEDKTNFSFVYIIYTNGSKKGQIYIFYN